MQTLVTFLVLISAATAFTFSNHLKGAAFRITVSNNHVPPAATKPFSPFPLPLATAPPIVPEQRIYPRNISLFSSSKGAHNKKQNVQEHFGLKSDNGSNVVDPDRGSKQVVTATVPVVPVALSANGISPPKFVYIPFLRRFAWVLQNMRPSQVGGGGGQTDTAAIGPFTPHIPQQYSTRRPGFMHTPEVQPDIEIASGGPQYPFNPPGSVTPTSASTTTIRHPLPPQFELASRPSITLPMIANTTSAPTPIRPIATYKPPVATRSPMKRNSCVVEAPFCSSCLAKISSSEPWFPYPPPLFIPAVCSRCSILQVILNRLPEEVTVFSDILKLASFGEIVDFNEVLTEANGQVTVLAPSDAAFAYLPISIDDLKQRLVRSPNELRRFILYHLLPGYVTSRDLKPDAWIATCLFEKSIYINNDRQVNGAPLQSRDINHKHGSIHTLGRVLWPVAEDSVQLYLDANPFLSQFASWYRNFARVSKNDMVTVFAPTNAAFERVAPSIRKNLAKNDVLKARTVQKHIVPGLWFSSSISPSGAVLTPMDGLSVTCTAIKFEFNDPHKYQQKSGLSKADKLLTFGSSRVIASDQFVTNGVIHIVDKLNTDQLELCGFS